VGQVQVIAEEGIPVMDNLLMQEVGQVQVLDLGMVMQIPDFHIKSN
jgi:hypothetical protein